MEYDKKPFSPQIVTRGVKPQKITDNNHNKPEVNVPPNKVKPTTPPPPIK